MLALMPRRIGGPSSRATVRDAVATVMHPVPERYRCLTCSRTNRDEQDTLQSVKERAWYLDAQTPRRPRFTTFNPETTQANIAPIPVTPLPEAATESPLLEALHTHLLSSDNIVPETVRFLETRSSRTILNAEEGATEDTGGPKWEWVIVAEVKGRGRGVVARAEVELKKWVSSQSSAQILSLVQHTLINRCEAIYMLGRCQEYGRNPELRARQTGRWSTLDKEYVSIS